MKKQRLVRILSCAVFAVLCFLSVSKCADLLEDKKARIKYTPFFESRTDFDVIFLGTSHMYYHVLPMEMWREYGIASFNWGYNNSTPAVNYYLLQDILEYTSPKLIVIDIFGLIEYENYSNGKYRTDRLEQQHVQFDSFPVWSLNKARAAKDVFDDYENNDDFIWNFIMYHNRWNSLGKEDFEYGVSTEKGACFLSGLGEAKGPYKPLPEDEKTEINSVCYPYFLKTLEYCQEKGIQVLCVCLPYRAGKERQRVANTVGEAVGQYEGCSYVNALGLNIVDYDTDLYSDNKHLNYSGASKVTSWLGRYIRDNYRLDDCSGSESWIQDYRNYEEYKISNIMRQEDLPTYLVLLRDKTFSGKLVVHSRALLESERLMALCGNAGIVPVFSESESGGCAELTVQLSSTGEVIQEVRFRYAESDGLNIMDIVRQ